MQRLIRQIYYGNISHLMVNVQISQLENVEEFINPIIVSMHYINHIHPTSESIHLNH